MELVTRIAASPDAVWRRLADLESHSEWMGDAEKVIVHGEQRSGVGARMTVPTRIGPFRARDEMTITEWVEGRRIVAEHRGVVTGVGSFEIGADGDGTVLTWREDLRFPWWLGGRLGHLVARPILRRVWSNSLDRFREEVEAG